MKIGAQLYTVRKQMQTEEDIRKGMFQIAEMGYKYVQVSNLGPIEPKVLKSICDENGIKIPLTHTSPNRLLTEIDSVIEEHNIYDCDYIGIGGLSPSYRTEEGVEQFIKDFTPVAEKIKEAGKKFMYHHHSFEFYRLSDKRWVFDHILDAFPKEKMGVICDTYWVQHAGVDICSFIKKVEGRLECVHLKDMYFPKFDNTHTYAAIGEGNIDFVPVIDAFEKCGAKYMFVEMDEIAGCPFDALKRSYDYIKTIYEEK